MKWNPMHASDQRITGRGDWIQLTEVPDSFPERAGVYVFADEKYDVKYVGEAGGGRLREEAVDAIVNRKKGAGAALAISFETGSKEVAVNIESEWISYNDPPNNKE